MNKGPRPANVAASRPGISKEESDGRLFAPTFDRNAEPILEKIGELLGKREGYALEIGSGTGQHAMAFAKAFPGLSIIPSDIDPTSRESIIAWTKFENARVAPPLDLSAESDWTTFPAISNAKPLQLVIAINVIHIAPFPVAAGIVSNAAATLATGGILAFYGPFKENGAHTAESNAQFDANLRARNPDWGVRDVSELTEVAGAGFAEPVLKQVPANNRILSFRKV